MPELIVILIIAFLVFGAGRLPEIGTNLGQAIRSFKKAMSEAEQNESKQIKEEVPKNKTSRDG